MDEKKLARIEKLIEVQSRSGNYDYDQYTHGLVNGMILIHSILAEKRPEFLKSPKIWLKDQVISSKAKETQRPLIW